MAEKKKVSKASPAKTTKAKVKPIVFTKMQGTGNDVLIIDHLKVSPIANPSHFAKKISNRRFGVGADQVIYISKSRTHDFALRFFNADGSEAETCGNGLRCAALYVIDNKYTTKKELSFDTQAGPRKIKMIGKQVQVDMGEPIMKGREIPVNLSGRVVNRPLRVDAKEFRITCLSMGNPHCVIFQDNLENFDMRRFGPQIEHHSVFPKRANVSFVNVTGKNELHVRVWERGAGETLACGSAACAVTVAGVLNGFTERKVTVHMPGGKLEVEWHAKDNHITLQGPAETTFSGEYYF